MKIGWVINSKTIIIVFENATEMTMFVLLESSNNGENHEVCVVGGDKGYHVTTRQQYPALNAETRPQIIIINAINTLIPFHQSHSVSTRNPTHHSRKAFKNFPMPPPKRPPKCQFSKPSPSSQQQPAPPPPTPRSAP